MRLVKSNETTLEKELRKLLWQAGLRYRKNNKSLFGKPEISFKGKKIVVFIDSCFWHGCPEHARMPKSNSEYWNKKIKRNRKRDATVDQHYQENNWRVLRFWEHQIKKDPVHIIEQIKQATGFL